MSTGGQVSIYYRLKCLSEIYEIDLLTVNLEGLENLESKYNDSFVFLNKVKIFERQIKSVKKNISIKSILYFLNNLFFNSKPRGASIANIEAINNFLFNNHKKYDQIIFENFNSFNYFLINESFLNNSKTCLITHNIESDLAFDNFRKCKFSLNKLRLFIEYNKVKKYENLVYSKANKILCISRADFISIKNEFPFKTYYISQHIALRPVKWSFNNSQQVIFNSNLNFRPNLDGLDWYIKYIHPNILIKFPNYKLVITGNQPKKILKKYHKISNISFTGFLKEKDFISFFLNSDVMINPVSSGSGVKIKMLDALSFGIPIVSRKHGVAGISQNIKINYFDDHLSFSKSIVRFLEGKKNKGLIEVKSYNDDISKKLNDYIFN